MIEGVACTARANGSQRRAIIAASALLLLSGTAQRVRADMVLVSQTELVMGSLSQSIALSVPSAGTVEVTLSDLAWPTRLASLSFSATTPGDVLASGSLSEAATTYQTAFSLTGPDAFYAHITATAQSLGIAGLPALGLVAEQIGFTPQGAPVPLPASVWLLLAGLGVAVAVGRRLTGWHPATAGVLSVVLPAPEH